MIARAAIAFLLAAEALAFYTLGELVMRIFPEASNELVSAPGFLVIAFAAFLAPAALDWFAVERGRRALAIGVLGLLVFYGALRLQYGGDLALWDFGWLADFVTETGKVRDWIAPVLVSSVLLLATWARAAWRARSGVWLGNAPRSLAAPFALVTLALLLSAPSEQAEVVTRAGVIFYGVALAALACSQLSQSGSGIGGLRSGGVTTLMLAGTGAFAVIGVLLVGVLLDPLVDAIGPPLVAAARGIAWLITYALFYPIAWVLEHLFDFLGWLFGSSDGDEQEIEAPAPILGTEGADALTDEGESLAARVTRYTLAGGAVFLGVAVVAGLIFILAILRRRAAAADSGDSESERIGGLGDDLRDAARNLFRRERRPEPAGEGAVRLYLDVLDSARRAGAERARSQTAHEFAPVLLDAFHRDVTDEITAAFEYARYAGRPPDAAALADLRRRWEQSGR